MPVQSDLEILSASYDGAILLVGGTAFGENQYDGIVEISLNEADWTPADSYNSWSDTAISANVAIVIEDGEAYFVRVTNGDNETAAGAGGFTFSSRSLSYMQKAW
jgi:hypothetical protein